MASHYAFLVVAVAFYVALASAVRPLEGLLATTSPPPTRPVPPPLILSEYLTRPSTGRKLSQVTRKHSKIHS